PLCGATVPCRVLAVCRAPPAGSAGRWAAAAGSSRRRRARAFAFRVGAPLWLHLLTGRQPAPYAGGMSTIDRSAVPDYPALLRLDGRGFVVVGAGQGIGRQAAHALAAAGARVVCVDAEPDRAEAVAAEVRGTAWVGDVRARDAGERLGREAVRCRRRLHALHGGLR